MKTNKSKLLAIALILVITLPACARVAREVLIGNRHQSVPRGSVSAEMETRNLHVAGLSRSYLLFKPAQSTSHAAMPLVMVFHGGGGNAEMAIEMSDWNDEAKKRGWMVAYPNGTGRREDKLLTWNAGNCCGYAQEKEVDDVAFVEAIIDDVRRMGNLDSSRVYATGISNGAMLSYRLACQLSNRIAAIAPVSGAQEVSVCNPKQPVSIMHFHGTADENVPFEGGFGSRARIKIDKRSVPSTLDEWRRHDRCSPPVQSRVVGDAVFTQSSCAASAEVILVKIDGGGHAWPGAKTPTRSGQTSSRYINATEEMARFFERHTR